MWVESSVLQLSEEEDVPKDARIIDFSQAVYFYVGEMAFMIHQCLQHHWEAPLVVYVLFIWQGDQDDAPWNSTAQWWHHLLFTPVLRTGRRISVKSVNAASSGTLGLVPEVQEGIRSPMLQHSQFYSSLL